MMVLKVFMIVLIFIKTQNCNEIFIVASWIGKEGYLSEKEIKELQASNLIRFSSHLYSSNRRN